MFLDIFIDFISNSLRPGLLTSLLWTFMVVFFNLCLYFLSTSILNYFILIRYTFFFCIYLFRINKMCTSFIHAIQLSCFMKVWRYSETYLHRTSLEQPLAFGIYMCSVFTELTNISYIKFGLFRILLYRYSGFGWDWFHFTK